MKTLNEIQNWLNTNPSQEEQQKVLNLINRGSYRKMRKEVYEQEKYLRKLQKIAKDMKTLGLAVPKHIPEMIENLVKQIENEKKQLPKVVKKEKKVEEK